MNGTDEGAQQCYQFHSGKNCHHVVLVIWHLVKRRGKIHSVAVQTEQRRVAETVLAYGELAVERKPHMAEELMLCEFLTRGVEAFSCLRVKK